MAAGTLEPEQAVLARFFPESMVSATERVLASFDEQVRALSAPSDDEVLAVVERVVLDLNAVNADHGGVAYETDEREELCAYIEKSVGEAGVDVPALVARRRLEDLTYEWREW